MVKPTTYLVFIQLALLVQPSVGLPIGDRRDRELCKRLDSTALTVGLLATIPVWGYCCVRACGLCVKSRTKEECDLEAGNQPNEHEAHNHPQQGTHPQVVKSQPSRNQRPTASNPRPQRPPPRTAASSPNLRGPGHRYYPGESPSGPSSDTKLHLIRPQRSITWADEKSGDASSLVTASYLYSSHPGTSAGSSRTLLRPSDDDRSRDPEHQPAKVRARSFYDFENRNWDSLGTR
ncbi:hypothetical protein F5887DRAFT_984298 [Amanita rubescens]|nr:hypothetical protein F5887DRAFT_984298 [Amanita rubescens]